MYKRFFKENVIVNTSSWFVIAWDANTQSQMGVPLAIFVAKNENDAENLKTGEAADLLQDESRTGKKFSADDFDLEVISFKDWEDEYAKGPSHMNYRRYSLIEI